jgi:hypothetical protein
LRHKFNSRLFSCQLWVWPLIASRLDGLWSLRGKAPTFRHSKLHQSKKNHPALIIGNFKMIIFICGRRFIIYVGLLLSSSKVDIVIPYRCYWTKMKNNESLWTIVCYVGWFSSAIYNIQLYSRWHSFSVNDIHLQILIFDLVRRCSSKRD